ncbi:ENPP4 triphosphatase, partial [Crypturellus undulatus]|nr:ENPP4 triphosphatase [Crypturellus undulatus]
MNLILALFFSSGIAACCGNLAGNPLTRLLLVSFDGFRADYLQTYKLPHLQEFIEDGVLVSHVTNSFITKTFPNHYSIVTGLYEESHGIVANDMYDADAQKTFSQFNDSDPFWWNGAVPIWVTNQQGNRASAAAMWPGSDVKIHNTTPQFFMKYNFSVTFEERAEKIVTWLNNSNPPVSFATLYWEEPDASGHKYGPDDTENMRKVLEQVDNHIGFLTKKLKALGLWDTINIIITSDHGMAPCSAKKLINLDSCIGRKNYTLIDRSPVAAVLPRQNKTYVYNLLKNCSDHMKVYLKEEIPERFHYRHNKRIQPIILVADEGWTIVQNEPLPKLGDHGYDNALPSMHPFLAARGPAFRRGYKQRALSTVDIYPMMCHILGLPPQPHNGTLGNVKCLLADQWCINLPEAIGIVVGALIVLATFTCIIIISKNRISSPRPFSRLQLQDDDDDPLIG